MFIRRIFVGVLCALSVFALGRDYINTPARKIALHLSRTHSIATLERQLEYQSRADKMKAAVLSKYNVDQETVNQAVIYALKYERPTFPRAEHMIALIGIESSWRPAVRSTLKSDPAVGLTQIRPGIWKDKISDPKKLNHIEYQIKYSAEILDEYHARIKHKKGTLLAYNVGLTAYRQLRYNQSYVVKFNREIKTLQLEV